MGLPWTFSAAEAFDLTPIGRLELGDRWYDIPPLTKGRFDRLLSFDMPALSKALLGAIGIPEGGSVGDAVKAVGKRPALRERGKLERWWRRIRGLEAGRLVFDAREAVIPLAPSVKAALADLWDVVAAVAPDIPREAWIANAGPQDVTALFILFAEAHDWRYIAASAGLDRPRDETEERSTLEAGLVSYCLLVPGYSVQGLLGTRVEGFYRLMAEGRRVVEARNAAAEGESGGVPLDALGMMPGAAPPGSPDSQRLMHLWERIPKTEPEAS